MTKANLLGVINIGGKWVDYSGAACNEGGSTASLNPTHGSGWIVQVRPTRRAAGPLLLLSLSGEVYNPIFRFMGRVFFSQTASIETYLKALGKKYGEDVQLSPS